MPRDRRLLPDGERRRQRVLEQSWEPMMVSRALGRLLVAVTWAALAAYVTRRAGATAWAIPTALGGGLAVMHAHRSAVRGLLESADAPAAGRLGTLLVRADARKPWLRPVLRRLLPFPEEAHFVSVVGLSETLGLLVLGWATGRGADVFAGDREARVAATALVLVAVTTYAQNLAAVVDWELNPPARSLVLLRPLIGPAVFGVAAALLAPGGDGTTIAATAIGCAYGVATVIRSQRVLRDSADALEAGLDGVRRGTLDDAARFTHAAVRNPLRPVLATLERITDARAQLAVRRLCTSGFALVDQLRSGQNTGPRSAAAVTATVLDMYEAQDHADVQVLADVDPTTVSADDGQLLFVLVSDLVTNAITAKASRITVRADVLVGDEQPPQLRIAVGCTCGRVIDRIPADGSLWNLTGLLRDWGGGLDVEDDGHGTHTVEAWWPIRDTATVPRALSAEPERMSP